MSCTVKLTTLCFTKPYAQTRQIWKNLASRQNNLAEDSIKLLRSNELVRKKPAEMKINSPQFLGCLTEGVLLLKKVFDENGHEIKIVGGAVRDLLLDNVPEDIDFATTATPAEMKEMFNKNDIRLINVNGEKHGTITARIKEKNFEVTTLRVDLVTDGRRAQVQFTKDWFLDASRRDLTINAMFLDFEGNLTDYFNGNEDLKNRILRFVGDPSQRIQEDYLRILRYFRFYGKIAKSPNNHLEEIMVAIRENAKGLEQVSGERVWMELHKILKGKFIYEAIAKMMELGVGKYIGLPENCNLEELKKVTDRIEKNQSPVQAITILAALFNTVEELDDFFLKIKPSNFERGLGHFLITHRNKGESKIHLKDIKRSIMLSQNISISKVYASELFKYAGDLELLNELERWQIPKFPINGYELAKKGITGKNIGIVMGKLKNIWIDKDFNVSNEELFEHIPNITENLSQPSRKKKKT